MFGNIIFSCVKLYCMYIINAISLIRTFHLSEKNVEPMNQRGSNNHHSGPCSFCRRGKETCCP